MAQVVLPTFDFVNHSCMRFSANFLGVGNARSYLGNASCVIEKDQQPWLLIDCGHTALAQYLTYTKGMLPRHIFITHLHFDHVGGLEQLFFRCLHQSDFSPVLYVPAPLVARLTQMLAYTGLAEGQVNLWDHLRLVPVLDSFWHQGTLLKTYPVRHHEPNSAFALHLPGLFFYTGDTRPIPELIHHVAQQNELVFHDCCLKANPSHTGCEEIFYEYNADVIDRMWVYHYHDEEAAQRLERKGLNVARAGQSIPLGQPARVLSLAANQA